MHSQKYYFSAENYDQKKQKKKTNQTKPHKTLSHYFLLLYIISTTWG